MVEAHIIDHEKKNVNITNQQKELEPKEIDIDFQVDLKMLSIFHCCFPEAEMFLQTGTTEEILPLLIPSHSFLNQINNLANLQNDSFH